MSESDHEVIEVGELAATTPPPKGKGKRSADEFADGPLAAKRLTIKEESISPPTKKCLSFAERKVGVLFRVFGHGVIMILRMGNKAAITQVFGAKNSEGSVRFKCEKLHKIPELGDMLEDWELSEMVWTYQRKCLSLANLAENLAAHSAFRGWTIKVDSTVKPYCSLYADFQVMALVEDLRANKKDVPPEDLLIGDNKSLAEMEKTYYRLDPKAKKHREQQLAGDDPATNDDW
jgi:hypothetical protein